MVLRQLLVEASAGGGGRVSSIVAPDSHPEFGIFGGNIIFGAKQQDISLPAQGLAFLTISIHQSTTYHQNPPRTRFSHLPLALIREHHLPVCLALFWIRPFSCRSQTKDGWVACKRSKGAGGKISLKGVFLHSLLGILNGPTNIENIVSLNWFR